MSHSGYESMGERYRELLDTVPLPSPSLVGASTDVKSEGSLAAKGWRCWEEPSPGRWMMLNPWVVLKFYLFELTVVSQALQVLRGVLLVL